MAAIPSSIKRNKKRRILVISAGGTAGGIQGMLIGMRGPGSWEIISHASVPYPERVASLVGHLLKSSPGPVRLPDLGWLEYKISQLFIECARTVVAKAPSTQKAPHLVALNKLTLWNGPTGENLQQCNWNMEIGDAQLLASSLGIPVLTDFVRHSILAGGPGSIPTFPGNFFISPRATNGVVALVNIGVVSRMTVIDQQASSIVIDSDTGPGTCLINECARDADSPESFDRDGSMAAKGSVSNECLDVLAAAPWFHKPAPKTATPETFLHLLEEPCLAEISELDRLATVTALTARTVYEFFRREASANHTPETVWLSGGGIHNLVLMDCLKTYFDTIPIKSVEEIGIPADMRIPLALGLTVDSFLSGTAVPWETGNSPQVQPLARWVLP